MARRLRAIGVPAVVALAAVGLAGCASGPAPGGAASSSASPAPAVSPASSAASLAPAATPTVVPAPAPSGPVAPASTGVATPPPGAVFDYQLSAPYEPAAGVTVVARDRTVAPAGTGYDLCYVNGFQTQPDESEAFARDHPDLLVQVDGAPLADPGWPDELIFDTSTAQKRHRLAVIVGAWIRGCKQAGYDGVEVDNLDSYLRTGGATTVDDNIALAAQYAQIAHEAGLAIAQKNTPDHSRQLRALGYDFAVAESCMRYAECGAYTAVYPTVLDIEYTDELGTASFRAACRTAGRPPSMILRDPKLLAPGEAGYHDETCPR